MQLKLVTAGVQVQFRVPVQVPLHPGPPLLLASAFEYAFPARPGQESIRGQGAAAEITMVAISGNGVLTFWLCWAIYVTRLDYQLHYRVENTVGKCETDKAVQVEINKGSFPSDLEFLFRFFQILCEEFTSRVVSLFQDFMYIFWSI